MAGTRIVSARVRALGLAVVVAIALVGQAPHAVAQRAPRNEVTRAKHYLEKFEAKVKRMNGQPFTVGYEGKEALKRIKGLKQKYPKDPAVEALYQRARKALMASKGNAVEITEEMLEYRKNGDKLRKTFAKEADAAYEAYKRKLGTSQLLDKVFPVPDPHQTDLDTMKGKYVVLTGVEYPANEFTNVASQYLYVGAGAKGYYYLQLSTQAWAGAYEALRRYRIELGIELPQQLKWTVIGKISGAALLSPDASKKKVLPARIGWLVEPAAIYVPDYTFTVADSTTELGGWFAGEKRIDEVKRKMYSVTSVPQNVTPERLVEIFATAIKERNWDLYLACIDPARQIGNKTGSQLRYHWEWHQKRFAEFYVHIVPQKAKIEVLEGADSGGADEDFFLDEGDKQKIEKISGESVKRATVFTKAYDERGRQYGSPKPHFLKKIGKGRWYIVNYKQPF